MTLSVVINTKNAEATLKKCLDSVKFADEIIIVDMHSQDKTLEIAQKYTNKIFTYKDVGFADPARNFALSKATQNWILIVDADEEVPISLKNKILALIAESNNTPAYFIARKNIIWDKWIEHTGWWPDYQLRFFKRGAIDYPAKIHTKPQAPQNSQFLPAQEDLALIHYNYPTISSFLEKMNRYTDLTDIAVNKFDAQAVLDKFFAEFLARYFVHQAYLDDLNGTALALAQSSYELFTYLKAWEKQGYKFNKNNQQTTFAFWRKLNKDLNYYLADFQVKNTTGFSKFYWQIRRKFKI